ncbi:MULTISPECIES: sensor histidine kinase [Shewanella]|uniref:histidine kinase n=1 Tax=Shewanella sedimentimangrovi TaxID=2814293 RepID=A0ABX7R1A4_9GAMM|nr:MULTISPECIES: ATP-binding protein [Shewanella]QSX36870.1 sensor histidine kinase [Shewanella sedimentimangrovi]QSX40479.1 sensor histidine kinase [Shewanella cyperi]
MTPIRSSPPLAADQLTLLRGLGLVLQLQLTFVGADALGLTLQQGPLLYVFALELAYLGLTIGLRQQLLRSHASLFAVLLMDSVLWIAWLYFSGGATNAFISLLLLPIAIAAVTLPSWAPWSLAGLTVLAYSLMLFLASGEPQGHQHHGPAQGTLLSPHYLGMWLNFLISAWVLTTSVALIARRLRSRDAELAAMRESQLRQEQLLALGTASAQMSHQLATPLASLRLLLDELKDGAPLAEVVAEMDRAMGRCEASLNDLRQATEAIRERRKQSMTVAQLLHGLRQQVLLQMPGVKLHQDCDAVLAKRLLQVDVSLLPSLLALVDNGAKASQAAGQDAGIWLEARLAGPDRLQLDVRDRGAGIDPERLHQLGAKPVKSKDGLGLALLLSHASLERLGGELHLGNAPQGGGLARVHLQLESEA